MPKSKLNSEFVYRKYESIYDLMFQLLQFEEQHGFLSKSYEFELLDFLLFGWSYFTTTPIVKGIRSFSVEDMLKDYQNNKEKMVKYLVNGCQHKCENLKTLHNDLSGSYIQFATGKNAQFDTLIELGGGCGNNLIRGFHELKESLNKKSCSIINAEFSAKGRELSCKLFEKYGMTDIAYALEFDHDNSEKNLESLKPYVQGKDTIIYTASSLEQIPVINKSFFETLEEIAGLASSLTISFCEPIAWQLAGMMPRSILNNSHEMTYYSGFNRNLYSSIQDWVDWSDREIFVHTICPSIFFNGYHISGIKVKSTDELKSFTWVPAS